MNRMTKLVALVMAMMMVFALGLSACGSKAEEPAADEGQNPIMNYVGGYCFLAKAPLVLDHHETYATDVSSIELEVVEPAVHECDCRVLRSAKHSL